MIWTPERIETVAKMWKNRFSASEIGKHLGVSKNAICGIVHRSGLPKRKLGTQPDRIRRQYKNVVIIASTHVGKAEVKFGECRYPFGTGPYTFCSEKCEAVYCQSHMEMCYIEPKDANSYEKRMSYWGK